MQKLDKIAEELFNKIRGRYPKVTLGTEIGEVTSDPAVARFFEFDYRGLGKVSVSLEEKNGIVVMYSKKITDDGIDDNKTQFFDFLKELRTFAKKRMLNFDTRDLTKTNLKKRDYQHLAATRPQEGTMTESKLYGTNKVSYQDIGTARLVIKHSQSVNPELAAGRTQNIRSMYIESSEGERFKYPYRHLNGARAMARHVAEGGNAYDDFGKHIVGLSEELSKLRKFKNYMNRSSVMAEGLSVYMDAVHERISTVKETIEKLQRENFYKETFENFEATIMEDVPEDVRENWIDQLTIRQFNEELQDVFPYIYKLVSQATLAEEIGPEELLGEERDDERIAKELMQKGYDSDNSDEELQNAMIELGYGKYMTRDRDLIGDVLDRLHDMTYGDDDGQPSSYDEYQDLYGGDEDFGGYDEAIESSIEELMGQFGEADKKDVDEGGMLDKLKKDVKQGWGATKAQFKDPFNMNAAKDYLDKEDEEAVDDATLIAQELKKMGVSSNASEDEIYKMIPKALKSLNLGSVLRQMNISKGYRQDMVSDILGAFSGMKESDKEDVLFQIEDEDGDKYEVVKYMGKVVAFDANPEELPGGGMGPYEYDPKTGTIETENGPKKTRKVGDQTFGEADFDTAFKKRIQFSISGSDAVKKYMRDKADQFRKQNKDLDPGASGKGLGIGVLDTQKAYKKAKKKGAKWPSRGVAASPNTSKPERLPDSIEESMVPQSPEVLKVISRDLKGLKAQKAKFKKDGYDEDVTMIQSLIDDILDIADIAKNGGYLDSLDTAVQDLAVEYFEKAGVELEGNAYAHAVRKAKMDGKKKGDKIDHPDPDEDDIVIEKDQTPLGEFILSYFDRDACQFPKGETAVLTMVEKDYGEQYIEPAKQFIEQVLMTSEQYQMAQNPQALESDKEYNRMRELAGLK